MIQNQFIILCRTAVRCLTDEKENAWFSVDFLGSEIKPTHYTLRHYILWNIESLRSWIFEGSQNGKQWTTISKHIRDESLSQKGASHTWKVQCNEFYSHFRIQMTDKNDNGHWFLCCSGFEIYGDFKYIAPNKIDLPSFKTFKYESDFDENGIIYAFGTNFGDDDVFINPYQKGLVGLKSSG